MEADLLSSIGCGGQQQYLRETTWSGGALEFFSSDWLRETATVQKWRLNKKPDISRAG
jgi:hypothetical protein